MKRIQSRFFAVAFLFPLFSFIFIPSVWALSYYPSSYPTGAYSVSPTISSYPTYVLSPTPTTRPVLICTPSSTPTTIISPTPEPSLSPTGYDAPTNTYPTSYYNSPTPSPAPRPDPISDIAAALSSKYNIDVSKFVTKYVNGDFVNFYIHATINLTTSYSGSCKMRPAIIGNLHSPFYFSNDLDTDIEYNFNDATETIIISATETKIWDRNNNSWVLSSKNGIQTKTIEKQDQGQFVFFQEDSDFITGKITHTSERVNQRRGEITCAKNIDSYFQEGNLSTKYGTQEMTFKTTPKKLAGRTSDDNFYIKSTLTYQGDPKKIKGNIHGELIEISSSDQIIPNGTVVKTATEDANILFDNMFVTLDRFNIQTRDYWGRKDSDPKDYWYHKSSFQERFNLNSSEVQIIKTGFSPKKSFNNTNPEDVYESKIEISGFGAIGFYSRTVNYVLNDLTNLTTSRPDTLFVKSSNLNQDINIKWIIDSTGTQYIPMDDIARTIHFDQTGFSQSIGYLEKTYLGDWAEWSHDPLF